MKSARIKFFVLVLFVTTLGLIALPQISLRVGGKSFDYPNVDPSLIGLNSNLGNLNRSSGIFNSNEVSATINLDENFSEEQKQAEAKKIFEIISRRALYSNLYDLDIKLEKTANSYVVIFTFPEYYKNPKGLAEILSVKGEITFAALNQQEGATAPEFTVNDIKGSIGLNYSTLYGNFLHFDITQEKFDELNLFFSVNQNAILLMDVDSKLDFYTVPDVNPNLPEQVSSSVKVLTAAGNPTDVSNDQFLKIVSTYFLDDPMNGTLTMNEQQITIAPTYSPEGARFTAFMFFATGLLIGIYVFFKKGFIQWLSFSLLSSFVILLDVVLLKAFSANISIATLIGFIMALIITILLTLNLLATDEDDYSDKVKFTRNIALFMSFSGLITIFTSGNVGILREFLAVILINSLSILVATFTAFKLNKDILFKLKFRR